MQYKENLSELANDRGYSLWYDLYVRESDDMKIKVYFFLRYGTPVLERQKDGWPEMIVPKDIEDAETYIRKIDILSNPAIM